eukprot:4701735-Alexandrium_andersonii.AAC.1
MRWRRAPLTKAPVAIANWCPSLAILRKKVALAWPSCRVISRAPPSCRLVATDSRRSLFIQSRSR